jgi:hypothetical protein
VLRNLPKQEIEWAISIASAHDRRHDDLQVGAQGPHDYVRRLKGFDTATRKSYALSAASEVERRRRSQRQHHHRVVLTLEEVERFLEPAPGIKCLSALSAAFGAARLRDSLTESLQYRFQTRDAAASNEARVP